MGDLLKFLNDRFRALIQALKGVQEGFNSSTGQYGGGGVDNISSKTDSIKSNTDTIKSDVAAIKTSVSGNKTNTDTIVTLLTQINSKMKTILVVTQAEYDLIDPKDPNTIYLITQDTQP